MTDRVPGCGPDQPSDAGRPIGGGQAGGPDRPIAADWLALRRALDEAARESSVGLLGELAATYPAGASVHVVDVGAGTGANRAYLEPRLPFPTSWTLIDHDPALLAAADNEGCRRVLGGIPELAGVLAELGSGPRLVTCSALLDLLAAAELDALVDAVVAAGVPALFALTVTGDVRIEPADAADELVRAAFDAHQARSARPGPAASTYVARAATRAGALVRTAQTPWRVAAAASTQDFLRRYLADRADAAIEQLAGESVAQEAQEQVATWRARRVAQVSAGELTLRVEHQDLLLLPA